MEQFVHLLRLTLLAHSPFLEKKSPKIPGNGPFKCAGFPDPGGMSVSLSVAQAVLRQYELLPKKGKPNENEYTILAGFVIESGEPCHGTDRSATGTEHSLHAGGDFITVALGTGSKCVGRSSMSTTGQTLHDSHAEIIACRSFRR
jgi:hypothetical protein